MTRFNLNLTQKAADSQFKLIDDLKLNRFEQSAMKLYLRFGAVSLILIATIFSVIMSIAIAMPLISLMVPSLSIESINDPFTYLYIVILVPLIVAPLCSIVFTRLLRHLNNACEAVAQLSTTDPLTGSANRRGFMDAARHNIHKFMAAEACIVGMVDLDKFKLINDTYGHHVGDQVLTIVCKSLCNEINNFGFVGRLGGDEFAFIVSGSHSALNNLQEQIKVRCTKLKSSNDVEISCSIGMVRLQQAESIESALARADQELYQIKSVSSFNEVAAA